MTKTMLWGLLAVLLAACSGGNEYSSEAKNGFLRSCIARNSPVFCECGLGQLQKEYTEQEFVAQEEAAKANQRFSDRMQQSFIRIRQQCPQT
ncbi:hypothetical protein ACFOKJ_13515 [Vogesella amnigena]|uniref:Lipoprotein n=1 Tax=Vogesella amnigena TaxID=1507449 RepID=A0ABV7TWM7_9NEIS